MHTEEEADFQAFTRTRWAHLVRTAYLLTGDWHHAEDLTQTALAKAYRSWRRVSRADSPDAYVRRMLVSCNSDRFRKRRVAERLTEALPEVAAPGDTAGQVDQRRTLLDALATLPTRQRAVVVLRYWDDRTEAEVAQAMGCSLGTVKSQAAKGLAKLRAHPGLAVVPADPGPGVPRGRSAPGRTPSGLDARITTTAGGRR
ncbi:SigE family RNA polymerase sigma factor [Kitasatospora sp. NPDC057904]|uniref:SigE family RNA polymerase sigma factor n=1 Tax=unclassified Kitasatospora TaxID=2633591 RepID=UPI0036DC21F8